MGVIVLGMHRSGTSALTRVVSLLGLPMGADDALVEPTDDNPAGHWEVEALSLFNEDLLVELGGHWSGPPSLVADELVGLARSDYGVRARKLIEQAFADRPFVWKDPRLCLLLPFWREILTDPPIIVASFRNPLEVAHSIARRDHLLPAYTLALWERHQRQALLDAGDLSCYLVDYAQLLADPVQVWTDLDAFLTENETARDHPATQAEVEAFVDESLHRQQRSDREFRQAATAEQVAFWEFLRARAGRSLTIEAGEMPPESPGIQLAFDEHNRMSEFRDLSVQQRAGIDDLLEQIADQLASIDTLQKWLDDSRAETAHTWSEVRRLETDHDELTETKALILDYLETVIAERDDLRARWDRLKWVPGVELALRVRRRVGS